MRDQDSRLTDTLEICNLNIRYQFQCVLRYFQEGTTPLIFEETKTKKNEIQNDENSHHLDRETTDQSPNDNKDHQAQDDGVLNTNDLYGKYK